MCRLIRLTRDSFSNTVALIKLTLWLKVSQRAHSLHPHAIHGVTCLSVRWLFPRFVSFLFISHFYIFSFRVCLFSVRHTIFNVVRTRTVMRIAPWRYTTLSQFAMSVVISGMSELEGGSSIAGGARGMVCSATLGRDLAVQPPS